MATAGSFTLINVASEASSKPVRQCCVLWSPQAHTRAHHSGPWLVQGGAQGSLMVPGLASRTQGEEPAMGLEDSKLGRPQGGPRSWRGVLGLGRLRLEPGLLLSDCDNVGHCPSESQVLMVDTEIMPMLSAESDCEGYMKLTTFVS